MFKRITVITLILSFCVNMVACGTILYPERKGAKGGKLDTNVVILDAIGLLFFFVPGVIAFAVDFATGTIYLPGGGQAHLSTDELDAIQKNGQLDEDAFYKVMDEKLNNDISMYSENMRVDVISSVNDLPQRFRSQKTIKLAKSESSLY